MNVVAAEPGSTSHVQIIQMVAENGWFPYQCNEVRQNPDYSNLRLVSKKVKGFMDEPKCGGPDFDVIVDFLNSRNGFNDMNGACEHCLFEGGEGCDACDGSSPFECKCKKEHRHRESVRELDPRLNPNVQFTTLNSREKSMYLLNFLREVDLNWHGHYYVSLAEMFGGDDTELSAVGPDLVIIPPKIFPHEDDVFLNEFKDYNEPFYNFIMNLLLIGWTFPDTLSSLGSGCSPQRHFLVRDCKYNMGGSEPMMRQIIESFISLHKSDEPKLVPVGGSEDKPRYALSQIQHLPELIRRCLRNSVDYEARALLGTRIADSIDFFQCARYTYFRHSDELKEIKWQPSFGMAEEEYVPLTDFSGFNPQHYLDNVDYTALLW